MRAAIALIAVALLGGAASADGADMCLTKREARTMWPKEYLSYWNDGGGRRCWGNHRRGSRFMRVARAEAPLPQLMVPRPALPYLPPELVPALPVAPLMFPPPSLFDEHWVRQQEQLEAARARMAEQIVYSTFAGPPPDVWPEAKPPRRRVNVGLVAMMLTAAFAFAAGIISQRWDAQ